MHAFLLCGVPSYVLVFCNTRPSIVLCDRQNIWFRILRALHIRSMIMIWPQSRWYSLWATQMFLYSLAPMEQDACVTFHGIYLQQSICLIFYPRPIWHNISGVSAPPVLITSGPLQCLTALTEISSEAITNQSSSKIAQEKVWRRYAGEQGWASHSSF